MLADRVRMTPQQAVWNKYFATYEEIGSTAVWGTGDWSEYTWGSIDSYAWGYDDYVYPANTVTGKFGRAGNEKLVGKLDGVWYPGTVYVWGYRDRTITRYVYGGEIWSRYCQINTRSSYVASGQEGTWGHTIGALIGTYYESPRTQYPAINVAANGHIYVAEGIKQGSGNPPINGLYVFYRDPDDTYRRCYIRL